MCTVSWLYTEEGYQVFCNRDERLARAAAEAPRWAVRDGVRYTAPVDPQGGGSWIAANEFGLTLCVLNGAGGAGERSRGLLLLDLVSAHDAESALDRLEDLDLGCHGSFTLLLLQPRRSAMAAVWDGEDLRVFENADPLLPLTSSSVDAAGAGRVRHADFAARLRARGGVLDAALLFDFHASHSGGPGPYSVCMHRTDAATVSFSHVTVQGSDVRFFYSPTAPCCWAKAA